MKKEKHKKKKQKHEKKKKKHKKKKRMQIQDNHPMTYMVSEYFVFNQ